MVQFLNIRHGASFEKKYFRDPNFILEENLSNYLDFIQDVKKMSLHFTAITV